MVGKRHLTQSEKHKRYTDSSGKVYPNPLLIHHSVNQTTDCPQNLAHSKKLANTFEELDKQKSKSVAKINGEKHLLKLKYKGLLKKQDCDPEIEETFFLQPGFRFHRNGDLRKIKDPRVIADVERKASTLSSLAKSNSSVQSLGSRSKGKSQTSTTSVAKSTQATGEGDGPVKKSPNVEKTIAEIERDLKEIKLDKDLININRRIRDVRSSLTFIRAHANDFKPSIPFIVQDHQNMFSSSHATKDCKPGSVESIKRLSKHFNKINCSACENRLKHDHVKTSPERSPTHNQKWQSAPRWVYVAQLESKSSHNKTRPAKSAKTVNKDAVERRSTGERRPSKSASSTSGAMQRKKENFPDAKPRKMKSVKSKSVLNKFKTNYNIPEQTQSEKHVDLALEARRKYGDGPMSSPNIVNASGENGNCGPVMSASKDDWSQTSKEVFVHQLFL